jgi:two-component SAPR family response regulator
MRCVLSIPLSEQTKPHENGLGKTSMAVHPTHTISLLSDNNKVLVVEDESLVAMMMAETLVELGFDVVGPCHNTDDAIKSLDEAPIGAAILDINLGDELVYPVAEVLTSRGVPFAFITGYGSGHLDGRYQNAPVLLKPIDRDALRDLFNQRKASSATSS